MRSWLSVLIADAMSKKRDDIPIAPSLYSLSNKMDNSLLAVRDINHKYIVVEKRQGTILKSHASPFYFFTGKYILSLISFNLYAQTLSCRFLIVRFFKQFLHSLNSYKHTKNQQ